LPSFPNTASFQGYLNSEMTQVRLAAVQCCCYLLVPFLMLFNRTKDKSQKITLLVMIQEVVGKLLAVAVTDSSSFAFFAFTLVRIAIYF
jgi:hypothetical protein